MYAFAFGARDVGIRWKCTWDLEAHWMLGKLMVIEILMVEVWQILALDMRFTAVYATPCAAAVVLTRLGVLAVWP